MASELKRQSSPRGDDEPAPKRQARGDVADPANGDEKQSIPAATAAPDHSVSIATEGASVSSAAAAQNASASTTTSSDATILDLCPLRPGDRIEVKWDLHVDVPVGTASAAAAGGSNDANISHKTPVKQMIQTKTITKWWGAVLLPPDGRSHILTDDGGDFAASPVPTPKKPADAATVPVRTLDYDDMPLYGFPERSLEDVVFLSDHTLLNMSSGTRAHYRRGGTNWEPSETQQIGEDGLCSADLGQEDAAALAAIATPSGNDADAASAATAASSSSTTTASTSPFVTVNGEEGIRDVLDSVLMKAMTGVSDQLGKLNAAQQRVVAAKIADAKEKLVAKMVEARDGNGSSNDTGGTVITPEYVKHCMEEVGKEL